MIQNGSRGGGVELRKPAYFRGQTAKYQIFRSTEHRKKGMTRGKLRDTCENLAYDEQWSISQNLAGRVSTTANSWGSKWVRVSRTL